MEMVGFEHRLLQWRMRMLTTRLFELRILVQMEILTLLYLVSLVLFETDTVTVFICQC